MTTITLKINEKSKKGKYLLGLIREMAKDESLIEIIYNAPNEKTLKAMEEAENGKLYDADNIDELFDAI